MSTVPVTTILSGVNDLSTISNTLTPLKGLNSCPASSVSGVAPKMIGALVSTK